MASAHDVAAYILARQGRMTAMKLQKLVYYSQAWAVVWDERPLFAERIEAWANGPVVRDLYDVHRGHFEVAEWPRGDANRLTPGERETIDAVLDFYGDRSAQWLSDLTHREQPWLLARRGMPDGERGSREITLSSLEEYYSSLPEAE
ncbi:MAG TPA: type II toxin-antitoxin system antitoxin SocA domain-containing protein [Longimicrobium sp.]|nr:type II toxin-antitoxin system antitoxin SocA domain-containing protein [Longimicrobium sp.]